MELNELIRELMSGGQLVVQISLKPAKNRVQTGGFQPTGLACQVRDLLADSESPLSAADIAQRLEITPAVARMVLSRLRRGGYVERLGRGRRVSWVHRNGCTR